MAAKSNAPLAGGFLLCVAVLPGALIGIFLGPTILAVGYTLLQAWMYEVDQAGAVAKGSDAVPPVVANGVTAKMGQVTGP